MTINMCVTLFGAVFGALGASWGAFGLVGAFLALGALLGGYFGSLGLGCFLGA